MPRATGSALLAAVFLVTAATAACAPAAAPDRAPLATAGTPGTTTAVAAPAAPRLAHATAAPLDARAFGARGDGRTDDTQALQRAINEAARQRRPVTIPAGTYLVEPNVNATWRGHMYGGLSLPSGTDLRLPRGTVLQAIPTRFGEYAILRAEDVTDVRISGPGVIRGERDRHRGSDGEWGMGIFVRGARRVHIEGVTVENCWGDGLYIGFSDRGMAEDVTVVGLRARNNRRQGISVVSARRVEIRDADIRGTRGTAPAAGIDLEPDHARRPNQDVAIVGGYFADNVIDLLLTVGNEDVRIEGVTLRSPLGIVLRDGTRRLRIDRADVDAGPARAGSGAFRVEASSPAQLTDVDVSNSTFKGGAVVVDIPLASTRGVRFSRNRIEGGRPGQRATRVPRTVDLRGNTVVGR